MPPTVESRSGRVLDLVKQFDEVEVGAPDGSGQEGVVSSTPREGERKRSGSEGEAGEKRKSKLKALDMFEKSGMIMTMVSE